MIYLDLASQSHPHELRSSDVPERLPASTIQELSKLEPNRALKAIAQEWGLIAAAISMGCTANHPLVTLFAITLIGARQHALLVIAHDASHFRLLHNRAANDWVANLLLAWPMFISVQAFRHYHANHHKYLGTSKDGNRILWKTHELQGKLRREWEYPKSSVDFILKILGRASGPTGIFWIMRGAIGGLLPLAGCRISRAAKLTYFIVVAIFISQGKAWGIFLTFWVIPYCTWHIAAQYMRLACEHSAVTGEGPYALTRTTLPSALEALFILPRQIGYHIEHHWYPSVPFYKLKDLHEQLMEKSNFSTQAAVSSSLRASLRGLAIPISHKAMKTNRLAQRL
jgi:fatty acid desaturase